MTRKTGVCSWSLQPASAAELVARVRAAGLSRVQLALDPLRRGEWNEAEVRQCLADAEIIVGSGMMEMESEDYSSLESIRETGGVRPDAHWESNLAAAHANAQLSRRLALDLVTLHAGFIPHDAADPLHTVMIGRIRQIVDAFAAENVRVGFETGQESADTLRQALAAIDRPTAGVNFDPANMILYSMGEPVEALAAIGDRVLQVHVKDALPTDVPGTWGAEVPAGKGAVDWPAFFATLDQVAPNCDLMIEREAGDNRVGDIEAARVLIEGIVGVSS